jgi:hypothetical protein
MTAQQRIRLAMDCLDERHGVSRLADDHHVSRKFVYQQQANALDALQDAFAPPGRRGGSACALAWLPHLCYPKTPLSEPCLFWKQLHLELHDRFASSPPVGVPALAGFLVAKTG